MADAGLSKKENFDRISIVTNLFAPKDRKYQFSQNGDESLPKWPRCSFFGVFDGHNGSECSEFLRDNLHRYIIEQECFPEDPKQAFFLGILEADRDFVESLTSEDDSSGSSINLALFVNDHCFIANVGDSRSILSMFGSKNIISLSQEHTVKNASEVTRVLLAGGQIADQCILPGNSEVSRSVGLAHSKFENDAVIISEPEIQSFKVSPDHDFIVLGSPGLF